MKVESFGIKKMLWGHSEALNLFEQYVKPEESPAELNILSFGASDPRHIMKTLAKCHQHQTKLHIYVLEGCPALIARQMILLSISLEPSHLLTLSTRAHLFMDVYGNALIRATSMAYIDRKAKHLIKCVTDLNFNDKMQPIFDLTHLKFVERDCLESVLSFWREKEQNIFNISNLWMQRLRESLRDRYDSREGAFDWDLQMHLKENGGHQICSQEYSHWRETGIAFTFPEYHQSHANKTFALQPSKPNGGGYVCDMTVGPFSAFGLSCNNSTLLKSNYGRNEYRASDISEYNLMDMLYEIHEQKPPDPNSLIIHKLGMTKIITGKIIETKPTEFDEAVFKEFNEPLIETHQMKVTFLSMNDAQTLCEGKTFNEYFDIVFVGRNYFSILKKEFSNIFAANASILFETASLSNLRKPEISEFLTKIRDLAKQMNLTAISKFNINSPLSIAKFSNKLDVEFDRKSM